MERDIPQIGGSSGSGVVPGIGFPIATTVRDALYDRIPLSDPELALISTPAFLRLERVQQLGFVSRIWPGARHARYDHSLGVLHLTRLALAHLHGVGASAWMMAEDARTLAAAALLHDVGHYPFSHAIEELGTPVVPHEAVGARLVEGPEIAPILREQWGVDPARVAAIIDPRRGGLTQTDHVLRGLLSGTLDMDKLDYLPRDARACNVPYGGVDTARLIDALRVAEVGIEGRAPERRIVIGAKGVSALHSLINARQEMFDNIYWHHTNRACMAMLLRAVQEALVAGALAPDDLTLLDDATLLTLLADSAMPAPTRRLTAALRERRIHKRAVEVSNRAIEVYGRLGNLYFDPAARRDVEIRVTEALGTALGAPVPPEAILIDIPKPERWRTDAWVQFDRPPLGFQPLMPWKDVVGLSDEDFQRYEEHRRLIRIVAAEPYRDALATHWEDILLPQLGGVV
ncbi:MAG: HD domain-containing protein [Thermomicrobiales bacterium]|nr:HD domain-containing protein [Thermomicrobiales bacterium]